MQAAMYATTADLEFLLAHGAEANAANKGGHTALMSKRLIIRVRRATQSVLLGR